MENKNKGWIKLYRSLLEHPINSKPAYLWVWINILLMASHSGKSFIFNNKTITLKPGEFITSLKQLSVRSKISIKTIHRILKWLENEKMIEKQSNNKFTLIKVLNWNAYQENDKQNDKQMTNKGKTKEKQRKTIKNDNNKNNINNNNNNNNNINKKNINKRERSINYLVSLTLEDLRYFVSHFKATKQQVINKAQDLYDYCQAKGKRYKDYKALLRNALARDYGRREKPLPISDYKFSLKEIYEKYSNKKN